MQAWPRPDVPRLPGCGMAPRLHDTATGTRVAASGPSATLYVCGITPYDATHLGHAATYVGFDLLVRAWLDAGFDVRYAQNVTDIDDPLLERAARDGRDWRDIAREQVALFASDMAALRVVPPDAYVGVVESIPAITGFIEQVRDRGAVYGVDGDLYFAVGGAPSFGSVSNLDAQAMLPLFAERGGDPDRAGKKDPLDSLLWRAERAGEPAWDSPLGRGRPGWHAECSAIALAELGDTVDVQGGGSDLIFPHHETCAALSELVTGKPCAHAYAHAGMVAYDGEKMSKSLGNLVFVSKLIASGVDPMAIRLALLAHHYRDDWEWTDADLNAASARLQRWRTAAASAGEVGDDRLDVVTAIRERLADDLDAPGALAVVDAWAQPRSQGHLDAAQSDRSVPSALDALLGVLL